MKFGNAWNLESLINRSGYDFRVFVILLHFPRKQISGPVLQNLCDFLILIDTSLKMISCDQLKIRDNRPNKQSKTKTKTQKSTCSTIWSCSTITRLPCSCPRVVRLSHDLLYDYGASLILNKLNVNSNGIKMLRSFVATHTKFVNFLK